MKVCLVNMDVSYKNKNQNLIKIEKHISTILKQKPDIDTIVFPELSFHGFVTEKSNIDIAEPLNGFCANETIKLAKKFKVNIIAGFIQKNNSKQPHNTAFAVNKKGKLLSSYNKNHLYYPSKEDNYFSKGVDLTTFNLEGFKCSLAICMDIRFPRLFEKLCHAGVEVIFILSNWLDGENKYEMLKDLSKARAIENQVYICNVDRSGNDPNSKYTSSHMISDPLGIDISKTFNKIYHFGELNQNRIKKIRKLIPLKNLFKEKYTI